MKFKTELHAHTSEVSPCSHQTAIEVADRYIKEGYTSIVVTNHYTDTTVGGHGTWDECYNHFLSGYLTMKNYAKDRLNVILGMELRFSGSMNDYLVFGFDETFLYEHPDLFKMNLTSFSQLAREHGYLTVQAHPLRNNMKIMKPEFLDGYEVFNGHFKHDSRNRLALDLCRRYHKIPTSGSDFHDAESHVDGGILTDFPITSMQQLTETVKSGNYSLICSGSVSELDGMNQFHGQSPKQLIG